MRVDLDAEQMQACLQAWRDTLGTVLEHGHGGPGLAEQVLATVDETVAGWLHLLRLCTAEGPDRQALADLTADVLRFTAWAEAARAGMRSGQPGRAARPAT